MSYPPPLSVKAGRHSATVSPEPIELDGREVAPQEPVLHSSGQRASPFFPR